VVTSPPIISAGKKSIMEAEPEEMALDEMEGETGDGNCFVSGGCTLHLSSLSAIAIKKLLVDLSAVK